MEMETQQEKKMEIINNEVFKPYTVDNINAKSFLQEWID